MNTSQTNQSALYGPARIKGQNTVTKDGLLLRSKGLFSPWLYVVPVITSAETNGVCCYP